MVPFSRDAFFLVFSRYNAAVWPAQLVLLVAAVAAVWIAALQPGPRGSRAVWRVLGVLWLWAGVVYHLTFFTSVNPAAWLFGALFVIQGLLFLRRGIASGRPAGFRVPGGLYGWGGAVLAAYALALYPLLIRLAGHTYPAAPTFGVPCPVVIYTFALLLWAEPPVPLHLLAIPLLWALIGASAAVSLTVWPDAGLTIGGLAASALVLRRNHLLRSSEAASPTPTLPASPSAPAHRGRT